MAVRWACLLIIVLVVTMVATKPRSDGAARHPEFGRIRDTVATYAKPMAELRQKLCIEPLLVRFKLWQQTVPPHLDLEGHHLYWWDRTWRPERTGFIQFWKPLEPGVVWEFAPCAKTDLETVSRADLEVEFYSVSNLAGVKAFGSAWLGEGAVDPAFPASPYRGVIVRDKQLFLARLVRKPSRVYVIQLTGQEQAHNRTPEFLGARYVAVKVKRKP